MTARKLLPQLMFAREPWQSEKDVANLSIGEAREVTKEIAQARKQTAEEERTYVLIENALASALGAPREAVVFVPDPDGSSSAERALELIKDLIPTTNPELIEAGYELKAEDVLTIIYKHENGINQ